MTYLDPQSDLLRRLAEAHRPVKKVDTMAYGEQYLVHCPVCDGSSWKIWQPGDAEVVCEIWLEYQSMKSPPPPERPAGGCQACARSGVCGCINGPGPRVTC